MELHLTHASRALAIRALPLEVQHLVITDNQPQLTRLFVDRYERLTKSGALDNLPGRLINRKPVEMKAEVQRWHPEPKVRSKDAKRVAYAGAKYPTATTLGKPLDMTNRKAQEQPARRAAWEAKKEAKK